jgi:hypothetical protein
MDAALKTMFPFRQIRDLDIAALKDSSPGHRDLPKAALTFGNGVLAGPIELRYESATEVLHLGEGVRLAALIDYAESGSFVDVDGVGFEVPVLVRMAGFRLRK